MIIPWSGTNPEFLWMQLASLLNQIENSDSEIIVSVNAKIDEHELRQLQRTYPSVIFIDSSQQQGAGYARNIGASQGQFSNFLFCDADDIVSSNWVSTMSATLERFDAAGSSLNYTSLNGTNFRRQDRLSARGLRIAGDFLAYAPGCSVAVSREAFEAVGGFKDYPRYAEDIDFSWRLQMAGYCLGFTNSTTVNYRLDKDFSSAFKRHFAYGKGYVALLKNWQVKRKSNSLTLALRSVAKACIVSVGMLIIPKIRINGGYILGHFFGRLVGSIQQKFWGL